MQWLAAISVGLMLAASPESTGEDPHAHHRMEAKGEPDPHAHHRMEAKGEPDPHAHHRMEAAEEADATPEDPHAHHRMAADAEAEEPAPPPEGVGVEERIGEKVPLELVFRDSTGAEHRLGDLVDRPTLVLPVYYTCPSACMIMMGNLSQGIPRIPLEIGEEYNVLAVSFDDEDGVTEAHEAKVNYAKGLAEGPQREAWKFLTADVETVHALTDSIGYRFQKTGSRAYLHPNALVALAPDGTIIRYLYGPHFLPFDMGMALTEAEKGMPGVSIRKLMTYCFDYEPEQKGYVFKAFRIFAGVILLAIIGFVVFLVRKRPGDDRKEGART
jgi:protein SCO1/2